MGRHNDFSFNYPPVFCARRLLGRGDFRSHGPATVLLGILGDVVHHQLDCLAGGFVFHGANWRL